MVDRLPACFLVKSEPYLFSFDDLVAAKRSAWDGVRNFEARNNLRSMRVGDWLLFYHSNEGKAVVGVASVARTAYPDPTAPGQDWSVVDVRPVRRLTQPVSLETIRSEPRLANMALLRRNRLSVVPVTDEEFLVILALSKTPLSALKPARTRTPHRPVSP